MDDVFYDAAKSGSLGEVQDLLRTHPEVNVNWSDEDDDGDTGLHWAARKDNSPMMTLLLAHPGVEVNSRNGAGLTPFYVACIYDSHDCIRLLLADPRANINLPDFAGYTPLSASTYEGHMTAIKLLIASGRDLSVSGDADDEAGDAMMVAEKQGKVLIADLLRGFRENPARARYHARLQLGYHGEVAAEVFALVVFLCDGLVKVVPKIGVASHRAVKFFHIARQLPMELQMTLCHRVVGSAQSNVPGRDSEAAFVRLAAYFLS